MINNKKGSVLLLSLFLISFVIAIFGISFFYIKNSKKELKEAHFYSHFLPTYEIYINKLIKDFINVDSISDPPDLVDNLNFKFINSPHNRFYRYNSSLNPQVSSDLSNPNSVFNPSTINISELSNTNEIEIKRSNGNPNEANIIFRGTSENTTLNLSPFLSQRGLFEKDLFESIPVNDNFIKSNIKEYIQYFVISSLESFKNGFPEYKNSLSFNLLINENKIRINNCNSEWEVYVPFTIKYKYKNEYLITKNHEFVIYTKPHYIVNVSCKLDKNPNPVELEIKVRGIAALKIFKVIKKY